jgi:hypothetical protein
MDTSYKDRYDFNSREIYDNIYDEDEYESVLIYRNEMLNRNEPKKEITKEQLEDYKS